MLHNFSVYSYPAQPGKWFWRYSNSSVASSHSTVASEPFDTLADCLADLQNWARDSYLVPSN